MHFFFSNVWCVASHPYPTRNVKTIDVLGGKKKTTNDEYTVSFHEKYTYFKTNKTEILNNKNHSYWTQQNTSRTVSPFFSYFLMSITYIGLDRWKVFSPHFSFFPHFFIYVRGRIIVIYSTFNLITTRIHKTRNLIKHKQIELRSFLTIYSALCEIPSSSKHRTHRKKKLKTNAILLYNNVES